MMRPRLIEGRSKRSEDSRAKGSASIRRKVSIALSTALSPSQGVEPWAALPRDLDAHGQHALGLDADAQVGGLAGDGEVTHVALFDEVVGAPVVLLLGLLVGDAHEVHPDGVLRGQVAGGAHHRRQAALHVVGAAADQPVALDARLELVGVAGDHVEVPVQHHGRARFGHRRSRPARGGRCGVCRSPPRRGPRASP